MLQDREIDPGQAEDIDKFERILAGYLDGTIDEDVFRVFRLTNGIYGQRQGGHNQMLRVRIPYGGVTPEQLDMFGHIADEYSRGWGHITTRQNIQLHYVPLERVPDAMRELGRVGLTTREACGDAVRNVMGCHLAGACPQEHLDITQWAEAANRHFLRNPIAQRLPRKFKINFSGCETDCGQAMFNDVGVVASRRENEDGSVDLGFRVFVDGGLGANPLRARMKWVVQTLGWEETQRRILKERKFLLASNSWPGGIPEEVEKYGDEPAGVHATVTPTTIGQGTPVTLRSNVPYERWAEGNVIRGAAKGTVSAIAYAKLGDITSDQFRALASIQREFGASVRLTNRQNLAFRDLTEAQLPKLYDRLTTIGMAEPGAELARDVVACPGADTCNLAVTQSRGLADAIGTALEEAGLADVGGIRTNISGCTNSCGQHHISDIGFFGAERRAHGKPAPGYQMLLGGYVGQTQVHFGEKALRLPAKNAPEAAVRVVRRFNDEREAGELFRSWLDRVGGAKAVAADLKELDEFPTPDDAPEYYVDYDETGPYVAETGESECAT